jgi:hypothetical protein
MKNQFGQSSSNRTFVFTSLVYFLRIKSNGQK